MTIDKRPKPLTDGDDVVGHQTFDTGEIGPLGFPVLRHEPLTRAEADAIIKSANDAEHKRAQDMPTEQDAVNALWNAHQRLKELGWKDPTYAHELKRSGITSRLIELGSTGIHEGYYNKVNDHDVWWIGSDGWPSHPCLVKPVDAIATSLKGKP